MLRGVVVAVCAALVKATHHHCVHDEKIHSLEASVDPVSLVSPQQLGEHKGQGEVHVDAFLEAVGLVHHRRLASTPPPKAVRPIRIAFDLSKLSSDPGRACTREGEVVKIDGGGPYRCANGDVLTMDKRDFIVAVLLKAIEEYFESVLSVQSVVGNLIVRGLSCATGEEWACCANSLPKAFKTQGVPNADFVLHVTARPTTGATMAWALPCNLDQFGRPISGQANFGPGRLDPFTPSARTEQISAALHEMTHALVFSKGRFSDFRQPLNGPKWGYNNVVSQSQGTGGIYVSKIITPSVAKQAKTQFNCFDWVNAGIELENGDSGSRDFSSHWEKRMLMNEYMTATSSYDPVYSALTLALFEDSGWYQVSFKNAQVLPWGYMEGCGVAQGRCSTWSSRYICSDAAQTGCTADYTSKGYCNVASYSSSIPAGFQYFEDPSFGGRDTYADYCPFYRAYNNGDCRGIGRASTVVNTNKSMEEIGPSSRCFQSSLSRKASRSVAQQPTCYKVIGCSFDGVKLSIAGKTVKCPKGGGEIRVSGLRGTLMCPPASGFCKLWRDKCSGNGTPQASGACECSPGFVGEDCSGIACPISPSNGRECGGLTQGECDYTSGTCKCATAYTGLTCSELVCPARSGSKNSTECSGHGECDRVKGSCTCVDGYSGKACECVPGCSSTSCGLNGACDCTTGGCSCTAGFSGVDCTELTDPPVTELIDDDTSNALVGTIADKEYKFYKVYLPSSTSDVVFSVRYKVGNSSDETDVDLYGSFIDPYPTSMSARSSLFVSDFSVGDRDEISLCGSLGVFPRSLNDSFRRCDRPTPAYLLETPGYFYVSVFGFTGGEYELSIVSDKCKNVTCSNHGTCGLNFPGVCTCDRYWTGDDCSIPKCGPDCQDLGTCGSPSALSKDRMQRSSSGSSNTVNVDPPTNGTLILSTECYGNGVCRLEPGATAPRCLCGDAFTYSNPTPEQAMCKELLPSVSSVQAFTKSFTVTVTDPDEMLDVNTWALFSIVVADDWDMLLVDVQVHADNTDAVLVVSKAKLPSMLLMNAHQASYSSASPDASAAALFPEFLDFNSWMSRSANRKVALSRGASTLSSGLYYVGVSNNVYAQEPLPFTLTVQATSSCNSTSDSASVCSNGGQCDSQTSQICTCTAGYFGQFCDFQSSISTLSAAPAPDSLEPLPQEEPNGTVASSRNSTSSTAVHTVANETLEIGHWAFHAFGVSDPSIRVVQFRLFTLNNVSPGTSPVLPLLLVRGPQDPGFPTLLTQSLQDFASVSENRPIQTVSLAVDRPCVVAQSPEGCFKVGVLNRNSSGEPLRYRLEVEVYESANAAFPSQTCDSDAKNLGICFGNGRCVVNNEPKSAEEYPSTTSVSCECAHGWTGLRCNSPVMFEAPHLWSEINQTTALCLDSKASFALARGELKLFRLAANTSTDAGLLVRVAAFSPSKASLPLVYVSGTLPRSMYDFTRIAKANISYNGDQVVQLESRPGFYWVAVFSNYDHSVASSSSQRDITIIQRQRLRSAEPLHRRAPVTNNAETIVTLRVETWSPSLPIGNEPPTNRRSSFSAACQWLLHTPIGITVVCTTIAAMVMGMAAGVYRRHTRRRRSKDPTNDGQHETTRPSRPAWRQSRPTPSTSSACA